MNPWEKDPIVEVAEKKQPWDDDPIEGGEEGSLWDYAEGAAGGFNTGLSKMAGAPVDITNSILSLVGLGSKEPVGGSEWIQKQGRKAGMYPTGPDTTAGRVVNRIGEEIGATALPAAGMLRAARGVPAAANMTRGMIRGQVLDPISRAPGATAMADLAASSGAGVGAGVAREMKPGNTTAETYGQIIGGFLPAAAMFMPSALAFKLARGISSRFSAKAQMADAQKAVSKVMGSALTGDAKKEIANARRLQIKAPGFKPSIAESSGSPPLIAQQQKLETEATGSFLDAVVNRRLANEAAIQKFSKKVAPKGDVDTEIIFDAATRRMQVVGATVERLVGKNVQKQTDIINGIPTINRMESGESIRAGVNKARTDASIKMSARAQELGINEADLSEHFNAWRKNVVKKYQRTSRFQDKKSTPKILNDLKNDAPDVKTTFVDIKAIRERVGDEFLQAISPLKKDRPKTRVLALLKKDVDELVNSLDPVLGQNYAQFRKEYFENFIKPFESGSIFKSRSKDGTGFYKTLDENVGDLFLNNQAAAKQYQEIFGNDSKMMGAIHKTFLDNMKESVTNDGVIDIKKYTGWRRKYDRVLRELPSVKQFIDNIETTQNSLWDRQIQLATRKKSIEDTAFAKRLTKFSKGDMPAETLLNTALNNHMQMNKLVQFTRRDPEAFASLKRNVWDKIISGNSEEILTSINTHKKSLTQLFGKEHIKNMEDVSVMRAMMERITPPKGQAYTPKPFQKFENITGMAVPQAGTRYWAFMSGRVPKYYLAFDIAKSALYKRAQKNFDLLLKEALYDERIAKEMADSIGTVEFSVTKARKLGARIFALGLPYLNEDNKQGEPK